MSVMTNRAATVRERSSPTIPDRSVTVAARKDASWTRFGRLRDVDAALRWFDLVGK